MKNLKKLFAVLTACMFLLACVPAAFAASVGAATIDTSRTGSLTIYKYDMTNAAKDGVWDVGSYVSTGTFDQAVNDALGGDTESTLGNGGTSHGYAISGVEFTCLKVADITTYSDGGEVLVLYGFNQAKGAGFLSAIGLEGGAGRFEKADSLHADHYYYTSDTLISALAAAYSASPVAVKNGLETYVAAQGGTALPLTDAYGKTGATELPLGLYLLIETKVPEMVTSTTAPFLVSLPMTDIDGDEWHYDVTVYPKNETGIPTLEKTVREAQSDTGKNEGTDSILDGFAHNATGSGGDEMEYQVLSTLPTITSKATALTTYSFYDTLSSGLTYKGGDVKLEFFIDKGCTEKAASWEGDSGKFTVTYSEDGRHMTIDLTQAGLDEVNNAYSGYTLRITYAAVINTDGSFRYGDMGNDNDVVLTWKRTSTEYYDTLVDDCHVYSFGIDLTKAFSNLDTEGAKELFSKVKFKLRNETDGFYVTAAQNEEGYYVTGYAAEEAQATVFSPNESGKLLIKGLEDDKYILTEIETAEGYTLLKDDIHITISASPEGAACDIYSGDVLGVLQNDPRYAYDGGLELHNIPQKQLSHNHLAGTATVDGSPAAMGEHNDLVTLTVVNTEGFDLPDTGDYGTWIFVLTGSIVLSGISMAVFWLYRVGRKGRKAR